MNDFNDGTALKKPEELTKKRFINQNNQMCKDDACRLAKKHGVVWGAN